jgi:hypothetical protein
MRSAPRTWQFLLNLVFFWAACTGWLAGCTGNRGGHWLTGGPTRDIVPGVPSPADRVDTLRKLAERADRADPDERQRVSSELATAYQDETNPFIRRAIVRAIGRYGTPAATGVLETAIQDSSPAVRIAACEGWARTGGADAARHLAATLSGDVDFDVRLAAAKALGKTPDASAVAALGTALEDRDPAMQFQAVQSLKTITGKDFGTDVNRWRQYVNGEIPEGAESISLAERLRSVF